MVQRCADQHLQMQKMRILASFVTELKKRKMLSSKKFVESWLKAAQEWKDNGEIHELMVQINNKFN